MPGDAAREASALSKPFESPIETPWTTYFHDRITHSSYSPAGFHPDIAAVGSSPETPADDRLRIRPSITVCTQMRDDTDTDSHTLSDALQRAQNGSAPSSADPTHGIQRGHFVPGVRAKVAEVLPALIQSIPIGEADQYQINIAEFGCSNSRFVQLMQPVIEQFAARVGGARKSPALSPLSPGAPKDTESSKMYFVITHEDSPQYDFRPFLRTLDTHPESYLNPLWQAAQAPSLQNAIFPTFISRPFGSRILPPNTLHLGFSLMDLHWTHTPNPLELSLATTAHAELATFLTARAHEFRSGGVFVVGFIARSDEASSGARLRSASVSEPEEARHAAFAAGDAAEGRSTPTDSPVSAQSERFTTFAPTPKSDIWSALTDMLMPCLQRLVSCGMLKITVARHLLSLPLHPRTPSQTQRVLQELAHLWTVDWSCGLGQSTSAEGAPPSQPELLKLPHPAWRALQTGSISAHEFSEHMLNMFKVLYESHFRIILRERGKLSKGAVEYILDTLWDVLHSRIDDLVHSPLFNFELEVQLMALRRR